MHLNRIPPVLLQHLTVTAFGGTLLLGISIAFAQEATSPKSPPARNVPANRAGKADNTEAAPTDDKSRNRAEASRRRGHGLGFEIGAQGDQQGLYVSSIEEKSAVAQAGLKQNDRIVSIDGRSFTGARQVQAYLSGQGGRRVPIIVERGGQQYTVQFTPAPFESDAAWLGVYLEEGDANMKGARITHVYPAGPAARAGLYAGDIVTQIAGQQIDSSADLVATVQQMEPKKEVEFVILRNERESKVPVVLGSRDAFAARNFERNQNGDDQQFAENEHNAFDNVPPYAMHLEHDRRAAEQHQRIENEIRLLREEIARLREELKRK